jgi:hypothetical protein
MPFNVQAKLERDENLALVIQVTWAMYAKALKSTWMQREPSPLIEEKNSSTILTSFPISNS